MDNQQGQESSSQVPRRSGKGPKRRKVRYFFVNGHLHKVLAVQRSQDLMYAWDYAEKARKLYVLSDVRKRMQNAFTITQVANMVGRHRMTIDSYIRDGHVRTPQRTYNMFSGNPGPFMLSEDEVLELHEYMTTLHYGRPRKDGLITNLDMPSREELKALVRQEMILYTRDDKGGYVPVWKEQIW